MGKEEIIRSFIAIDIGEEVRRSLGEFQAALRKYGADVKWVRPEGMHCTLRFLGNLSMDEVELANQAMIKAASGIFSFEAEVRGIGMFPNTKRPRVIWSGIEHGKERLSLAFENLEKALRDVGFGPADKPFNPHLTLGRVKSIRGIEKLLKSLDDETAHFFGTFKVDRLILFRSRLHPQGATYSVLQEALFSG